MKTQVIMAGEYPTGTGEKLQNMLPDSFLVSCVTTKEQYEAVNNADVMILRGLKLGADIMNNNKQLKMIMRWGAGFDAVDIEEAGKRGILVTNTPGANAHAVAELTVLLMLAVGRKLVNHNKELAKGIWSKNLFLEQSVSLNLKQVGLIGGGNIGRQVAKRVQAFGAKTVYYDPFRLSEQVEKSYNLHYIMLEELIKTSDIISLHLPLTNETKHMINRETIRQMKQGAILINAARGGLIDETALIEAVNSAHIAGAGIDCIENEPIIPENPLINCENIIITPHIGGNTKDLGEVIVPILATDIIDFFANKPVANVVNKKFLI